MDRALKLGVALVLSAVLCVAAAAQTIPPLEPLKLTVDCSRFRGPDDNTAQVELYYSFAESGLTYKADSAGYSGALDLTVVVQAGDSAVRAERFLVPHSVADTAKLRARMNLIGVYALGLPHGEFIMKVIGRDRLAAGRRDSLVLRVPVRPVGTGKALLSDVEFASVIRKGTKGGTFYKNTLDVIPNVGGLYGEEQMCFYYAEAYNLLADAQPGADYRIRTSVFDAVGREVMSRDRTRKRQAESTVIVDNFGVSAMKTGAYTLQVALLDTGAAPLTTTAKRFYVYNPTLGVDSSMLSAANSLPLPVYASMDEVELDREFKIARYEASSEEKSQYEELKGADAKRKFLSGFWRRRQPGLRDEYMVRAEHANRNFQMMGREGYRTDRGRVYIIYGPPDDYERHPNESESRPYEIWYYNQIQGGVQFVFVQRTATGDYELVHSTHRNELHDEGWQRFIQPN